MSEFNTIKDMLGEAKNSKFEVTVEQNGGEYYGPVYIEAGGVTKLGKTSVLADHVRIDFGEKVLKIKKG